MKRSIIFTKEVSFIKSGQYNSDKSYILSTLSILLLVLLHAAVVSAFFGDKLGASKIEIYKIVYEAWLICGFAIIAFLVCYPIFVMVFVRPRKLISYLISGFRWNFFSKERLLFSYPVLVIISMEVSIYTFFKNHIPNIKPFWLDVMLQKLDKVIFLGNDPWFVFQHLIGNPNITRAIDFLYHPVWLFLLLIFFIYHAYGSHPLEIRLRFFLSYIISWAGLGNLLATALSSAGPCYFNHVTGKESPYVDLMRYLYSIKVNGIALNSVRFQEKLWGIYINTKLEPGSGISAMPSIHIATAVLFALGMRHTHPILEKLLYCYTFIIWVGSICLGWHYAVDGIVSLFFVIVIWYYVEKLTDKIIFAERVGQFIKNQR